MDDKSRKLEWLARLLDNFCSETRNVHKRVKEWASDIKSAAKGLKEELDQFRQDCWTNGREMAACADVSSRASGGGFPLAPTGNSPPKRDTGKASPQRIWAPAGR